MNGSIKSLHSKYEFLCAYDDSKEVSITYEDIPVIITPDPPMAPLAYNTTEQEQSSGDSGDHVLPTSDSLEQENSDSSVGESHLMSDPYIDEQSALKLEGKQNIQRDITTLKSDCVSSTVNGMSISPGEVQESSCSTESSSLSPTPSTNELSLTVAVGGYVELEDRMCSAHSRLTSLSYMQEDGERVTEDSQLNVDYIDYTETLPTIM